MSIFGGSPPIPNGEQRLETIESGYVTQQGLTTTFQQKTNNPADQPPPQVANASVVGTSQTYARADHTHKSSVQRGRVSVPLTSGRGVVALSGYTEAPVVVATAETPTTVTDGVYVTTILEALTTPSKFEIMVYKAVKQATLPGTATALLGYVVNLLVPASGSVTVDYISAPATT